MIRSVRGLASGLLTLAFLFVAAPLSATWSIIAIDMRTGLVVISSATCVSAQGLRSRGGLMSIQAVVVPGVGIAAAQAGVDGTRANQMLIFRELARGTDPDEILRLLSEDENLQRRQFGILDLRGRAAGFSGADNGEASLAVQGDIRGTGIHYAVQGNILASNEVVLDAVNALHAEAGTVMDRVMAAMEAADRAGGDRRCSCESTPIPETSMPCTSRSAHVAYLVAARPEDPIGEGHSDGEYSLILNVDDETTRPDESPNPVETLRMRYERWKAEGGPGELGLGG